MGRHVYALTEGVLPNDLSAIEHTFGSINGVVLPSQTGHTLWLQSQDLVMQMLLDALEEANRREMPGQSRDKAFRIFMEQRMALGWIFTPGEHFYGFEWTCLHVNLNPELIREQVRLKVPRARAIEEHLLDPIHVPAPAIPAEILPNTRLVRKNYRQEVLI